MIFKTFSSDIDKIDTKWGMFGKSFYSITCAIIEKMKEIKNAFLNSNDLTVLSKNLNNIIRKPDPRKESIQFQLINVESKIPKINEKSFNFDTWLNNLNDIDKKVKNGTMSWQDYSNSLKENEQWIAKWGQETEGQSG